MLKTLQNLIKQDSQNRVITNPENAQDIIPVSAIYEGGIFRHGNSRYSICFAFSDVNFSMMSEKNQEEVFYRFEDLINAFDTAAEYKITINNRAVDKEKFKKSILLENLTGDDFDDVRDEYNEKILLQTINDNDCITQERYLTVAVNVPNLEAARAYFNRVGPELQTYFDKFGSDLVVLSTEERLKIMHSFYRPGEEEIFAVDNRQDVYLAEGFKNYICSDDVELVDDKTIKFTNGDTETYARTLFLKDYANFINPSILAEVSAILPKRYMLSIDTIAVPTEEAIKEIDLKLLSVEANITRWGNKQNESNNFVSVIPPRLKRAREVLQDFYADVTERDQKMLLSIITLTHTASSLAELNADTKNIQALFQQKRCQMSVLRWQQIDGLNTALPWGVRALPSESLRSLSTESLAAFMPLHVQEILMPGGEYIGQNAISKKLVMLKRDAFKNGNSWIFGVPGAGKSMAAKNALNYYMLGTDADIIVLDPEGEYTNLVEFYHGEEVVMSANGTHNINALDINANYADNESGKDPVALKSQFVISLCEQMAKRPLSAKEESIIDRCTKLVYADFKAANFEGQAPTLEDFYAVLKEQPEVEAEELALTVELFTAGSLSLFAKPTNVNTNNRLVCYNLRELTTDGVQLARLGMSIIMDSITNRLTTNRIEKRNTIIIVDEAALLFQYEHTANFFFKTWKRIRKYGGYCIGITQNVGDLLQSATAETMLSNSEIVLMFSQANADIVKLSKIFDLSPEQTKYISNVNPGQGLLKVGKAVIPVLCDYPTDTKLYQMMTTKLVEANY